MNYDKIAAMKVNELRSAVRCVLKEYNTLTQNSITSQDIAKAPKARLLYILTRYWVEYDVEVKCRSMFEDLQRRENLLKGNVELESEKILRRQKRIKYLEDSLKSKKPEPLRTFEAVGTWAGKSFRIKLKVVEVIE